MSHEFKYEDGLYQANVPIDVASLGSKVDVWFDIAHNTSQRNTLPTAKQWAAWQAL